MIKKVRKPGVRVRGIRAYILITDKEGGPTPREFTSYKEAAEYYGCSEDILRYKLNTGGDWDNLWYVYVQN